MKNAFVTCAVVAVLFSLPAFVKNENSLTSELVSKQNGTSHLRFVDMKIRSVERGSFRGIRDVDKINISSNQIREIQGGVFNDVPTRSLDLSRNAISRVDSNAFDNMTGLSEIWMVSNELKTIDANWFQNCPKLNVIVLASNSIGEVPAVAFRNLRTKFPVIVLRYNKIRTVNERAFVGMKSFGVLDLYANELGTIPDKPFPDLKEAFAVDFGQNHLGCLSITLLQNLVNVGALGLRGNDLTCECLGKLDEFGQVHQTPYVQYDIIDCPL